ncbi:unnamed protein product [Ectocarpus sp. 6 AP-2014]
MSAEIRLERSREQNKQSSKKARIRRKGEEESLKHEIESLQVGQAASAWEIFVTPIRAEPVEVCPALSQDCSCDFYGSLRLASSTLAA